MPSGVTAGDGTPFVGRTTGEDAVSLTVPHERTGVGFARHAFEDQMTAAGLSGEAVDDAVLVLSELVSNAVRHASPLPSGEITVRWAVQDDVVHLEISDGGALTRPRVSLAALTSLGGRGLQIVRTVSSQWGVTEDEDCVTVWADVPRAPTTYTSA